MARRRGLTLVEVLVTVALSAILIALIVGISGQVQSAVSLSTMRLVAVEQIRALEDQVTKDLARMIPLPDGAPNPPFKPETGYGYTRVPPVTLERVNVTRPAGDPTAVAVWPVAAETSPPDPAFTGRCADVLQIFASGILDTDKPNEAGTGRPPIGRGVIRYAMEPPTTGGTTGGSQPGLRTPVGGGPQVGRLRRFVKVSSSDTDPLHALPNNSANPNLLPPVLVDNVVSFQIDYLDGRSLDKLESGGRSADRFIAPNVNTGAAPNPATPSTVDGTTFAINGKVMLDCGASGPRVIANEATLESLMPFAPIGAPVLLRLKPDVVGETNLPQMFLVRARGPQPPDSGKPCLYLTDRPIQEAGVMGTDPLEMKCFLPPAAIRITVVVLFGKGPENQTARFVRVIPVPR